MVTKKQKKIIKDIKKTSKELNDKGLSRVEILRITAASIGGLVLLSSLGLGTDEIVSRMKKSEGKKKEEEEEKDLIELLRERQGRYPPSYIQAMRHIFPPPPLDKDEDKDKDVYEDVELTYPNGMFYGGGLKNGKPHGQGTMVFKNGDMYEGQWKDGKLDGKVKYTCSGLDEPVIMKWNNGNFIKQLK